MKYRLLLKQSICKQWLRHQLAEYSTAIVNIALYETPRHYVCIINTLRRIEIDKVKLSTQMRARFGLNIVFELQNADKNEYPIDLIIDRFYRSCQHNLPKQIVKKVIRLNATLNALDNLDGYIITVAGKLVGAKHSRKKYVTGVNKYTGSYLHDCIYMRVLAINTTQGVVGIKLRIIHKAAVPGRFKLVQTC